MPLYLFQCSECELQFERNVKMGVQTHVCPMCEQEAPREFQGQTFGHTFPQGNGNTGVHDQDYPTSDKAVGRDATKKWALYEQQKKVKALAREHGHTHALTRKDTGKGSIEYTPMDAPVFDARKRMGKDLIKAYDQQVQEKKEKTKSSS